MINTSEYLASPLVLESRITLSLETHRISIIRILTSNIVFQFQPKQQQTIESQFQNVLWQGFVVDVNINI